MKNTKEYNMLFKIHRVSIAFSLVTNTSGGLVFVCENCLPHFTTYFGSVRCDNISL